MVMKVNGSNGLEFPDNSVMTTGKQAVKAWVNFNGTGTIERRESFNVSSITDNGTGDYTVNFTTAMPDANYIVAGTGSGATTNMLPITPADATTARTTSAMRFVILASNGGTAVDCAQVGIAIFR